MTEHVVIPRGVAAQLAIHTRLAAHHAAVAGAEPAAAEAILAWAILVVSGGADVAPGMDAILGSDDVVEEPAVLPAYRAAADQAEQLLTHFDGEELFDLAILYGRVGAVIDGEIERLTSR